MSDPKLQITEVLPWGRSLEEYRAMFALSDDDLCRSILSCADGPASFNAEMHALGHTVTSIDPVYQFAEEEIRQRIEDTRDVIIENTRQNQDSYHWETIPNLETLSSIRMKAMNQFLDDFEWGKVEGRYRIGALPSLEVADREFDLVLCSHCLFTYTDQLDEDFHLAAVREMLRAGNEVRIFPLLDMNGTLSRHLSVVESALRDDGARVDRVRVDYEFQKVGNEYLGITRG